MSAHGARDGHSKRRLHRRGGEPYPEAPELGPGSHGAQSASGVNPTPAAAVANVGQSLSSLTVLSTSSPTSSSTAADHVATVTAPSVARIAVPVVAAVLALLVLSFVGYRVYLRRTRRRPKLLPMQLPQIMVHSDFHTDALPSPPLTKPTFAFEDEGDLPSRPSTKPDSRRRQPKNRSVFDATAPIAVTFPSGDDDEKAAVGLPRAPAPAVRRPNDGRSRKPTPETSANRLSVRSSSLVAARLSTASASRIPAIQVTPCSPVLPSEGAPDVAPRRRSPKLVTVIATFSATLPDELPVYLGETLQIVEEYQDQWCLVERTGRGKQQRGVVPLCCLQEKEPSAPVKRFSFAPFGYS